MKSFAIAAALCCGLLAQDKPAQEKPASLSGTVRDISSGKPVPNEKVSLFTHVRMLNNVMSQSKDTETRTATSDEQGRYAFKAVPPGSANVMAGTRHSQTLNLTPGQDLTYDLRVHVDGTISGKVVDENGDPAPNVDVFAVGREYVAGSVRALFKSLTHTNDAGEYTLERVPDGRPVLVYAALRPRRLDALSGVPRDPKMRRQVLAGAFYPNSRNLAGAAPVTLRSGEKLEAIDVHMRKAPSFCAEATLTRAGVPGAMRFEIAALEPAFGMGASGGMVGPNPGGQSGADGKIRVCDLTPGAYALDAIDAPSGSVPMLGRVTLIVDDRDVTGIQAAAMPAQPVNGEVVLEGEPPAEPIKGRMLIALSPLTRASFHGEDPSARASIPGPFQLPAVLEGEYSRFPSVAPEGYYLKDVTYAGRSVLGGSVQISGTPATMRVTIAPGATRIDVTVTDAKGEPAASVNVLAVPDDAVSEGALAARLVGSSTDQNGVCALYGLRPGKYHVFAVSDLIDRTPEQMKNLLDFRATRGEAVEVSATGVPAVRLKLISLQ